MPDKLPPDPQAQEKWERMQQGEPSKQAFAPVTGGMRWAWGIIALFGVLILIALLLNLIGGV